jgi:Flp pilus assembly protein TadD
MSLLMDALKKAELAKRQGGADDATTSTDVTGLSLEPLSSSTPALEATTIPDAQAALSLSTHLEELDARFLEEAAAAARQVPPTPLVRDEPPPPAAAPAEPKPRIEPSVASPIPPPRPATEVGGSAAARNVFAAKQPEKTDNRRGFAIAVGVLTMVSVIAIGGYFWWQLQPKAAVMAARPAAPPPAAPIPPPAPATGMPSPPTPAAPGSAAGAPPSPASAPTVAPATAATPQAGAGQRPAKVARAASDDEDEPQEAARPRGTRPRTVAARSAEPVEEDSPIRVTRTPLRVDPALARGYDALGRGELNLALLEYQRANKNDPRNTDALHGLAAIALRQGRPDIAEAHYRQIFELDPQDSVAITALLNQRGQVDPGATESRLKSLAAGQPELAAPQFALGNLYARQGRWNEAQQAYFRAYNAEPENPDILFNLAVSLEHLRQNKLALQYYQQALNAAGTRPAGFDRERATARVKALQN